MPTYRVTIQGKVQGVGYRAWTAAAAQTVGLSGWVRNRQDGSVEAVFSGPEELIQQMITACHKGPPAARVEWVEEEAVSEEVIEGFDLRPTV